MQSPDPESTTEDEDEDEMANLHNFRCPQCGGSSQIEIRATAWVRLRPQHDEAYEGFDWDGGSGATCDACNFEGEVDDLVIDETEAVDDETEASAPRPLPRWRRKTPAAS